MLEPPAPAPQPIANAPPRHAPSPNDGAASAPGRGQGEGQGQGRGQRQRRRGGRGRSGGARGRGGEQQLRRQNQHQPDSLPNRREGGQSPSNIDGEGEKKRNNNRRRPRRRGRGGGRGGGEVADDAVGSNAAASADGAANGNDEISVKPAAETPASPRTEQAMTFIADSLSLATATADDNANANATSPQQPPKQRGKKKGKSRGSNPPPNSEAANPPDAEKRKKRTRHRRKKNANGNRAWRQFIPPGIEDPISLQPLADLPYPPFAVVVDPPHVPILPGMWPPPPIEPTAILSSTADGTDHIIGEVPKTPPVTEAAPPPAVKEEAREIAILKEQWGAGVTMHPLKCAEPTKKPNDPPTEPNTTAPSAADIRGRHLNLFDGRVLAYYLVSTLQFIDPLNRRDLTRPELAALDAYLTHHGLGNARVTEAYDAKGVTVSTAGSAAQTAGGRAEILQQEARAILSSFHISGGPGGGRHQQRHQQQQHQQHHQHPPRQQPQGRDRRAMRHVQSLGNLREDERGRTTNSFQRMYAEQEGLPVGDDAARRGGNEPLPSHPLHRAGPRDTGVYEGEGGSGLLLIDDDINPGLRSGVPGPRPGPPPPGPHHDSAVAGNTFYSARHIAEMHGQEAQVREGNFPSLSSNVPAASMANENDAAAKKAPLPPAGVSSKSLSRISKLVKKTDPKEVERQRKAREDAQRRAEMSKLRFFDPDAPAPLAGMSATANNNAPMAAASQKAPPSEAVIERNRNLAKALGVAPATVRNGEPTLTAGWARPVTPMGISRDEFGNELLDNAARYPDSLLAEARERMTELLKLERQWKKFLADDRSPGYSLKAMDRPHRKFVHEYSDFWRLKTESFDPEGRRYVHCSKLADTSAPHPLLSEAARKWRGPAAGPSPAVVDMATIPTGPSMRTTPAPPPPSTDGWCTEQRVPLKLLPRNAEAGGGVPASAIGGGMTRSTSTPSLSMTNERPPPPRFADLCDKERPRLQLAKRSIPAWDELERRRISQEEWNAMAPERQEAVLRDIEEEEARTRVQAEREKEKEEARVHRLENRAKKQHALREEQRAILASAFASDDDSDSSGSDWFEGDLEFDGSDDEGM